MEKIRNFSQRPLFLALLSACFLFASCSKEALNEPQLQVSGRDIMKAIFFFDGPGTKYIPEINDQLLLETFIQDEYLDETRANINLLLDAIELSNPTVFSDIKRDMTSGDHIIIMESLNKYSDLIFETTNEIYGTNSLFTKLSADSRPLTKLVDSYFPPNERNNFTPTEIRSISTSNEFREYVSSYFNALENEIGNGRTSITEDQQCIVWFGAVALAVIYVVVVLEAGALWTDLVISWDDGVVHYKRSKSSNSLLKEQIINSIAVNFNNVN